ncbi:MAG TPA: hypothetical protein PLO89_03990 [Spirochaetota bacterium]|nr:hypothetical protein [Spirochaetota bacterium]
MNLRKFVLVFCLVFAFVGVSFAGSNVEQLISSEWKNCSKIIIFNNPALAFIPSVYNLKAKDTNVDLKITNGVMKLTTENTVKKINTDLLLCLDKVNFVWFTESKKGDKAITLFLLGESTVTEGDKFLSKEIEKYYNVETNDTNMIFVGIQIFPFAVNKIKFGLKEFKVVDDSWLKMSYEDRSGNKGSMILATNKVDQIIAVKDSFKNTMGIFVTALP